MPKRGCPAHKRIDHITGLHGRLSTTAREAQSISEMALDSTETAYSITVN